MRRYVIDANVIAAIFKEDALRAAPTLSAPALPLSESLGREAVAYLDDGGIIEAEWAAPVDAEWFAGWYAQVLVRGGAQLVEALNEPQLRHALESAGFPNKSRDIWYVRTARAIATSSYPVSLITEDPDFIKPAAKASPHDRGHAIQSCRGPVARVLSRHHVVVTSLCRCA